LYARGDLFAQMHPTIVGPNAVVDFLRWLKYDLTPLPGAARFAMGTASVSGPLGLLESVNLLLELGLPAIDAYVTGLASYAIERLEAAGYSVLTPKAHGPIVTFRAAPDDARTTALVEGLTARQIVTVKHWDAHDNAYIRASLHCYNTPEEIDRFIAALKEISA
jgi:selenocysteine lyase/cysteine desulfurase